jgi:hypothetical protein
VSVEAGNKLEWSIKHKGHVILASSAIGLQLENGEVLGDDPKVSSSKNGKSKKKGSQPSIIRKQRFPPNTTDRPYD